ncbi:hypothetical protein GF312_17055 [Candidatus Poribacteria bacterium]|nr:hypothetical protein [Candidatus Poribacteria bacterium]
MIKNKVIFLVVIICIFSSYGCREREESPTGPGSTSEADKALKEAELMLKEAGLDISFEEPGELLEPEDMIPDLKDLEDPEKKEKIEEAIGLLNTALNELDAERDASISDQALLHLYLGFLYMFDAMSRLLISDDPAETFILEFEPGETQEPWYSFEISQKVQNDLASMADPIEYPLAFTVKERQAIIDAMDLIDDAIVKPLSPDILPQFSSVDRPPYYRYALWHFNKAAALFGQYKPEIMDAMDEFNRELDKFRRIFQDKSEMWGFTYNLPPWR